jgi:hypothetical protein
MRECDMYDYIQVEQVWREIPETVHVGLSWMREW